MTAAKWKKLKAKAGTIWNREVATSLNSGRRGLSGVEAARRLAEFGPNELVEEMSVVW